MQMVDSQEVIDSAQTYSDYRDEIKSTQSQMDYEEIKREMSYQNQHIVELDRMQPQTHRWVDRGKVMSCEGANHPSHRCFKR